MVWTPSLGQHPSSQVQNARNNFRRPLIQIPLENIRPKLERPKQNECTFQLSANTPQVKFKMLDLFFGTRCFKSNAKVTHRNLSAPSKINAHPKSQPTLPESSSKHSEQFSVLLVSNPTQQSPNTWAPQQEWEHMPNLGQHSPSRVRNIRNDFRHSSV